MEANRETVGMKKSTNLESRIYEKYVLNAKGKRLTFFKQRLMNPVRSPNIEELSQTTTTRG